VFSIAHDASLSIVENWDDLLQAKTNERECKISAVAASATIAASFLKQGNRKMPSSLLKLLQVNSILAGSCFKNRQ